MLIKLLMGADILPCEELCFVRKGYFVDPINYQSSLRDSLLKLRDLVWLTLTIPCEQTTAENSCKQISGFVLRSKFKKLKKKNMSYKVDGKYYKLSGLITNVEYCSSENRDKDTSQVINFAGFK